MPFVQHHEPSSKFTGLSIESISAKVDEYVVPDNNHFAAFENAGTTSELYDVSDAICSNTSEGTEHCVFYNKQVELEPGGYFIDDTHPVLKIKFSQPGRYYVNASTAIYTISSSENTLTPTMSDAASVIEVT